jgi:hypothetical protein
MKFWILAAAALLLKRVSSEDETRGKKILALGGNGFIGSAVLYNLLNKGQYKQVSRSNRHQS